MRSETGHPLEVVSAVLGAPRSTVYARRLAALRPAPSRPGPKTAISDEELVALIWGVIADSPFSGEGYRKVRARLRREQGVRVGGKRVLRRLMRREGLLAPQRTTCRRVERPPVGSIVPDAPNVRWGVDGTLGWTREDGWCWVFCCVDHHTTAEAWSHVAKTGDRFAALQPVYQAVMERFGHLGPEVARGISVRHDWGSQYRSHHFTGSLRWLGNGRRPRLPRGAGTAAPNGGSAPSRNNAFGPGSTKTSTTSPRPSPASPTSTTPSGSSNVTATSPHGRPTPVGSRRWRRDRHQNNPRNRVRFTPLGPMNPDYSPAPTVRSRSKTPRPFP